MQGFIHIHAPFPTSINNSVSIISLCVQLPPLPATCRALCCSVTSFWFWLGLGGLAWVWARVENSTASTRGASPTQDLQQVRHLTKCVYSYGYMWYFQGPCVVPRVSLLFLCEKGENKAQRWGCSSLLFQRCFTVLLGQDFCFGWLMSKDLIVRSFFSSDSDMRLEGTRRQRLGFITARVVLAVPMLLYSHIAVGGFFSTPTLSTVF